jgi:hypothetical protein
MSDEELAIPEETRVRMRSLFLDHLEHTLKVLDLMPTTYEKTMVVPLMVAAQTLVNELIGQRLVSQHEADILVVRLQRRYVNAFLTPPEVAP